MIEFDALTYQQQQCFLAHSIGLNPNYLNFKFTLDVWTYFLARERKVKRPTQLKQQKESL